MSVVAVIDWQNIVDALGLGSIYALMAVGIGLVFGVLRLVNFAYGQLIMAGAFTIAYASRADWPAWAAVLSAFGVVIALSLLMELTVFRPLRTQSPAVMLVATFAVSFLLQSTALLIVLKVQGQLGVPASAVADLSRAVTVAGVEVRKVTIVSLCVAAASLVLLALLLGRTTVGLQMRAAATDFTTARLLGVSANRVIALAVLLAGVIAAAVSVLLTARNPYVQSDFALHDMIIVLVGVVVGGIDRLWTATLGGFAIGFASGIIYGALPTDKTAYLPSAVFALVIVVLLVRPAGLFVRARSTAVERV
jgi:branched-chain amino acid transport system permease protein